ncbi:class I SAM-dependent methyltransferase [Sphingomonas ginsenosidivorax]|uniref:Class I SAM-dependent methyltransferase n=2 Tax=Sphingomonas ginsenosidivorax TaxID=862135 RepID=A0A5C6UC60_9SPHN|nr:class I SAM-dependent methyltransferase [Sphingomonas ginsenosidivorax]
MLAVRRCLPGYADMDIHESSPTIRGLSTLLRKDAPGYIATQFFPDTTPGALVDGVRCENLEAQTFASESFDLVVTQDVMEHVFDIEKAYKETFRTLRPGGYYIHTTPMYKDLTHTHARAKLHDDGTIEHLFDPEYHGNPINGDGALVTYHFGYDLVDLIASWTPFDVECYRANSRSHGIVAEFIEVLICRKPEGRDLRRLTAF